MCDPVTATVLNPSMAIGTSLAVAGNRAGFEALFPTPELPKRPDAPDAAPKSIDPAAQAARERERDKARAAAGRESTILTGGGGLKTTASTAPKTLLGQ